MSLSDRDIEEMVRDSEDDPLDRALLRMALSGTHGATRLEKGRSLQIQVDE